MKISPWTFAVFGILGGTAVLNSLVLYFAVSSAVPSMEDSPYERGQDYSLEQEQYALVIREGWSMTQQTVLATSTEPGSVSVSLAYPDARPLVGAGVRGMLKRFDSNRQDTSLLLNEKSAGNYQGKISVSEPGIYLMILEVSLGEKRGKFKEQIQLR